jgi:outer membrane protein assembly factor BamD (BamD/ComL family)
MMKIVKTTLLSILCVSAFALLVSCATQSRTLPEGLTAGEIFQRAQDAADRGDYALGITFYTACQQRYPDDKGHMVWSAYEIAFLYHKMGKNDRAATLINALLAEYGNQGDSVPPAPLLLSQKLKERLEASIPKKP